MKALAAIRQQRYSISDEETITGIIGFAVPVAELSGPLTAAVHVSAFRDLVADTDIPAIVAEMQVCSDAIASAMGLHDEHEVHA